MYLKMVCWCAFAAIAQVRRVVASVVALLRDSSASLDSSRGVARSSDWTAVLVVDRDGKRIKELCAAALQVGKQVCFVPLPVLISSRYYCPTRATPWRPAAPAVLWRTCPSPGRRHIITSRYARGVRFFIH
jgi:hypothetical protein